ncbi:hypothetical protein [Mesorhizobium sp.]|uniref:hypothetical protein n=1 Tax=Mesorhizobium sp. TaxID=1871066 RepID=UPI00120F30C9|nr:hypothetical protein [Mesorhizobium sp.]TIX23208.1 MAG: hypothetical protein E5V35_23100 [Mesorhizobium sp.]
MGSAATTVANSEKLQEFDGVWHNASTTDLVSLVIRMTVPKEKPRLLAFGFLPILISFVIFLVPSVLGYNFKYNKIDVIGFYLMPVALADCLYPGKYVLELYFLFFSLLSALMVPAALFSVIYAATSKKSDKQIYAISTISAVAAAPFVFLFVGKEVFLPRRFISAVCDGEDHNFILIIQPLLFAVCSYFIVGALLSIFRNSCRSER